MLESCLYQGHVKHTRVGPVRHHFSYNLYMILLDLDRIQSDLEKLSFCGYNRYSLLSFHQDHYLRQYAGKTLKQRLLNVVKDRVQLNGREKIYLLTQLRCLGVLFNPVSFYFIVHDDASLSLVAEVTNTPWLETHCYILPAQSRQGRFYFYKFDKQHHVSPFLEMDYVYQLKTAFSRRNLLVYLENSRCDNKAFFATLTLQKLPLNQKNINKVIRRYPFMSWRVILAIYWQALKIYRKGNPFYHHP